MIKNNAFKEEVNFYPGEWERTKTIENGAAVLFRPILPQDEALYQKFMQKSTAEDIRHRFLCYMKEIPQDLLFQFTHVDYDRSMAFVAIDPDTGDLLGGARYAANPASDKAEYAIMTRSDMQGKGIGMTLMHMLIDYATSRGIHELFSQVMPDSPEMINMCKQLGFEVVLDKDDHCYLMTKLALPYKKK